MGGAPDATLNSMPVIRSRPLPVALLTGAFGLCAGLAMTGCANPGPPKPPSLHLPAPVKDLTAERTGFVVELHFTSPTRTTDQLLLKNEAMMGSLCRQVGNGPCVLVPGKTPVVPNSPAIWHDHLPKNLTTGPARLLAYRVELANAAGHSAGPSEPAYIVAGEAPKAVLGLEADGTRQGVLLRWTPAASASAAEVVLQRTTLSSAAKAVSTWLKANAASGTQTLDTTAQPEVTYEYVALRERTVQLGGRTLELRSEESAPLRYTLHEIYPPIAPTNLVAAGFGADNGKYAADLIWQAVDDSKLAGYNIYREPIDATGAPTGAREKLNTAPVAPPAFHDATALATVRYRYSVTAVGLQGGEGAATNAVLEPTQTQ
jgi:hypothetical protein